jgi:hypothetical protein
MTDQIIGEVTGENGYPGLIAALRSWVFSLNSSLETVNDVSGLTTGYVGKLLAPTRANHSARNRRARSSAASASS